MNTFFLFLSLSLFFFPSSLVSYTLSWPNRHQALPFEAFTWRTEEADCAFLSDSQLFPKVADRHT